MSILLDLGLSDMGHKERFRYKHLLFHIFQDLLPRLVPLGKHLLYLLDLPRAHRF